MERFGTEGELLAWYDEVRRASHAVKDAWAEIIGVCVCYYEGRGWTYLRERMGATRLERLKTDLNLDGDRFRVTLNRLSPLVQRAAVMTQPTAITVQASPPPRTLSPEATTAAQLDEDVANVFVKATGLVPAWIDANFMRSVIGAYGVGLDLRPTSRRMAAPGGPVEAPALEFVAFPFLPLDLDLDPYVGHRDLARHEHVCLTRAWTLTKVRRVFGELLRARGVVIDDAEARTLGELSTYEHQLYKLTSGAMYGQYREFSRTKGARVIQVHRRDASGRFGVMEILLEVVPGRPMLLSELGAPTPFGGDGLPLALLHGHRRGQESVVSIGETAMLKDDQDRLNILATGIARQLASSSKHNWLVDMNGQEKKQPAEIARDFTNAVGGLKFYNSGTRDRPGNPPQLVTVPPPQGALVEMARAYQMEMRGMVHTSPGHFGETKSHVPDASFQRGLDEAGAVADGRVFEDKTTMERLITNMVGTVKSLCARQDPAALAVLDRAGFDGRDMLRLAEADPVLQACELSVRDGSIRVKSWNSRMERLDEAVRLQAVDARTYRRELATTLDAPVVDADRAFNMAFDKIAEEVLAGARPFTALPLAPERAQDLLDALERALVSRRGREDPAAGTRVARAIQSQRALTLQMAAENQAAAGAGTVGAAQTQSGNAGDAGTIPPEAAFADLTAQLSSAAA